EKILGIVKIWTIVKYFYPYPNEITGSWDNALEKYLGLSQKTTSDEEYYILIQEMMATLNDSHVSTFHPSILNFSELFIAPIKFEWIENKVVITAVDKSITEDICVGDVITTIKGLSISYILKKEAVKISSSNMQGLLSTVINPGYYVGAAGSKIKLGVISKGKEKTYELARTVHVFQFMNFGDNKRARAIINKEIGYINLAEFNNSSNLEDELIRMKETKSLILDLRNSYPTADFQKFLQMLCQQKVESRITQVPIVTAKQTKVWQYNVNTINPISSFSYNNPVVVLIDKTMISRPEDIAIALKSYPNVRFVGEQTQGTDGEITKIHLPGGGETSFTGQIVKFGNGTTFQRVGIVPDIKVQKTIDGVKNNTDEILEKAIKILRKS
ncbi:MAG: hypothetical protein C0594_02605, partial [Marinilabiliales bacterium]